MRLFVCSLILILFSSLSKADNTYEKIIDLLNKKIEKVKELEARADQLIKEKNNISDRERVVQIISELNSIQQGLKKEKSDIRELDYDLRFRYPEKGEDREKLYKSHKRNADELLKKEEFLIDKLDRVLAEAKKIYGPTQKEMETARKAIEKKEKENANKKPERFKSISVSE